MEHEGSTFLCGCTASFELLFFAKELDELVEEDTENTSFFVMYQEDWFKYQFAGAWTAISMATIKPAGGSRTVVAISPNGAYWEVNPGSSQEVSGEVSSAGYALRALAAVDSVIYACGMGRSVLRRKGPGDWDEIGPGVSPEDGDSVVGFEDLAGLSEDEMYAVGWRGEIWQYAKGKWRRLDSPVSVNLNALCCADDGTVYIVGDDGIMLRGRNETWEILETDKTDNLMDVAYFAGRVYVATDFEILRLDEDTLIAEDAFRDSDDLPETCLHLLPAADGLMSMGTRDLFRLHDGVWERLV